MTTSGSTHLDAIVAGVREDLAARRAAVPFEAISTQARAVTRSNRLREHLFGGRPAIIAEIKRASPSKGWIRRDLDAVAMAREYVAGGVCAISVLTEGRRFGGSLQDLADVRSALPDTPLLRKDFILDGYMLAEARVFGADIVLLMVSVLGERIAEMLESAASYGLDALVEVHDESELKVALDAGVDIVGINNRNLKTLAVDLAVSERMLPMVPSEVIKVIESGISSPEEVRHLAAMGADAFLVGETLVRSGDPASEIGRLLSRQY